jgi:hypothetical protein
LNDNFIKINSAIGLITIRYIFAATREVVMEKAYKKNLKLNSNLSDKYRLNDIVYFDKRLPTIEYLIANDPSYLWKLIHKKHSNVSLVRDAYFKLKARIHKINPKLVEEVESKHRYHKANKRLRKEHREGTLGKEGSRFKKIASRKILKE